MIGGQSRDGNVWSFHIPRGPLASLEGLVRTCAVHGMSSGPFRRSASYPVQLDQQAAYLRVSQGRLHAPRNFLATSTVSGHPPPPRLSVRWLVGVVVSFAWLLVRVWSVRVVLLLVRGSAPGLLWLSGGPRQMQPGWSIPHSKRGRGCPLRSGLPDWQL